jgi:hypothetical protein
MSRLYFHGGAGGTGDSPGDAGDEPAAVADPEGGSGAGEVAATDDAANAEADRQAYIAGLVQKGIEAALPGILARFQPAPAAPAAPPTASRGVVAELEREATVIAEETKRLDQAFETQGATAGNLVAQNRLAMRLSNFNARLLAHGMTIQEQERQIDGAAKGFDTAKEAAWKRFAAAPENQGVAVRFLSPTFEQEYASTNPPAPAKTPKEPIRPVDVSGGGGGGMKPDKIRTVSQATYNTELEAAEDRGDIDAVVKMGRDRRAGRLKVT